MLKSVRLIEKKRKGPFLETQYRVEERILIMEPTISYIGNSADHDIVIQ